MFIGNGCVSCPNNTVTKNNRSYFVQAGLPHMREVFEGEAGNKVKQCRMVLGIVAHGLVLCAVPDSKSSRVQTIKQPVQFSGKSTAPPPPKDLQSVPAVDVVPKLMSVVPSCARCS